MIIHMLLFLVVSTIGHAQPNRSDPATWEEALHSFPPEIQHLFDTTSVYDVMTGDMPDVPELLGKPYSVRMAVVTKTFEHAVKGLSPKTYATRETLTMGGATEYDSGRYLVRIIFGDARTLVNRAQSAFKSDLPMLGMIELGQAMDDKLYPSGYGEGTEFASVAVVKVKDPGVKNGKWVVPGERSDHDGG